LHRNTIIRRFIHLFILNTFKHRLRQIHRMIKINQFSLQGVYKIEKFI